MDRTNFYQEVAVFGTKELDHLWNSLSGFEMQYQPSYYRVTSPEHMRPDRVSFKVYGVVDFWWVVCLVNGITNPLTELTEGLLLTIPNKLDIYNFQRKYRLRRSR